MGLSVVSATLIVVTALALASAHLARDAFAGSAAAERARAEASVRNDAKYHSSILISSCCTWSGILLRTIVIEVTNTGTTVLNASRVVTNVLVDGVLKPTSEITSATIGGATVNTWAPGEKLVLVVTNVASNPVFVKVVANNGAVAHWRPV